jgi:hypothetical protein
MVAYTAGAMVYSKDNFEGNPSVGSEVDGRELMKVFEKENLKEKNTVVLMVF